MRIFLIGFMGSGKSHSGSKLAGVINYRFIDLDDWIEEAARMSIAEIFTLEKEEGFRQREKAALREMKQFENIVVATGGGTPCFFDNMDWMNRHGLTIYLQAPAHLLARRLQAGIAHRPLLQSLPEAGLSGFIENKLAERQAIYEASRVVVAQQEENQDITASLLAAIQGLKE